MVSHPRNRRFADAPRGILKEWPRGCIPATQFPNSSIHKENGKKICPTP
ncbi:hypothetical protein HMPREF0742_01741 [Rothia aeria F0184]|uniref:Uncharacterized protein n=1 Tax=Rothia aeria F0184 TaxID=888019 RepID=U7V3A2_9MICC|nr:hypothetical protein HMPREF0742_01741 [Rothia aeria F0184]